MFIILGVVVVLFGVLYLAVDYKNKAAVGNSDNPYGKDKLDQATIDQLDDPLYQDQITPEKLEEKLKNKEDVTVYFYSPTCFYCQNTTPVLVPLAEELDVEMKKLNLLEFDDKSGTYGIESTPTLVYYENGKEVDRVNGEQPEEMFRAFFEEYVVDKK